MENLKLSRGGFAITLVVALLAGCGGARSGPGTGPIGGALPAQTQRGGSYLYIADDSHGIGIVYFFSYPDFQTVKAITRLGYVHGPCASRSDKVWVPAYGHDGSVVFEFKRGETKAIAQIKIPKGDGAGECALDSMTRNLAVLGNNGVDIFKGAVQGKPIRYRFGYASPIACAYDNHGNLFVDGIQGSSAIFLLWELRKGSNDFVNLTLGARKGFPGGLVWDGQHMAISTGGNGIPGRIYRFDVVGSKVRVVQVVHPDDLQYAAWFAVGDNEMAGTSKVYGQEIKVWPYPQGGHWILRLDGTFDAQGLAISPAP